MSVPVEASGAEALGAAPGEVAATSATFSGVVVHAALIAAIAVSCFAGGWSLGGSNGEEVAVAPQTPPAESPAVPRADVRSEFRCLENRIDELEARLETSRRRVAQKTDEILDLKTKLAAHVTTSQTVFDPA